MYTAYPDEEPIVVQKKITPKPSKSVIKLVAINNMIRYSQRSASDLFAGIGPGEKTQYSHKHQQMKKKGGRPPKDYELTEAFCDFCRLVQKGHYREALPLYYYLLKHSGDF